MENTTVIYIFIFITIFAFLHFQSMRPTFNPGDRVTVIGSEHMIGQKTGIIKLVQPFAYGIVFDGMETMGIHKWYSQSELTSL